VELEIARVIGTPEATTSATASVARPAVFVARAQWRGPRASYR
jgi:hypothetical protein